MVDPSYCDHDDDGITTTANSHKITDQSKTHRRKQRKYRRRRLSKRVKGKKNSNEKKKETNDSSASRARFGWKKPKQEPIKVKPIPTIPLSCYLESSFRSLSLSPEQQDPTVATAAETTVASSAATTTASPNSSSSSPSNKKMETSTDRFEPCSRRVNPVLSPVSRMSFVVVTRSVYEVDTPHGATRYEQT